jgi:hypothetical protein
VLGSDNTDEFALQFRAHVSGVTNVRGSRRAPRP